MDDREPLRAELAKVVQYGGTSPAPPNEAATCDWIILPVLQSLGYSRHEILPQATEGRVGRPDYTILPETEHTWFVEAKSWGVALESTQADQALNYAHANGRRWVLLTNGREWRLYDDTIQGKSEDRLVGTASLEETDRCGALLGSLTRASVIGARVERYVASTLVRKMLDKELRDPASPIVRAILSALKKTMPVEPNVRDIVSYFAVSEEPVEVAVIEPTTRTPGSRASDEARPRPSGRVGDTLHEVRLSNRGVEARGTWDGREFVVKEGSKGRPEPLPSYVRTFSQQFAELSATGCHLEGNYRVVMRDLKFKTPSAAAGFLNARSTNGWLEWRMEDGRALDILRNGSSDD